MPIQVPHTVQSVVCVVVTKADKILNVFVERYLFKTHSLDSKY